MARTPTTETTRITQRLSVAIAPEGRHPRLVRVRVDGVAIGDLCFPSQTSLDHFLATLAADSDAVIQRETELITDYDPALFAAPPRPGTTAPPAGREPGRTPNEPGKRP